MPKSNKALTLQDTQVLQQLVAILFVAMRIRHEHHRGARILRSHLCEDPVTRQQEPARVAFRQVVCHRGPILSLELSSSNALFGQVGSETQLSRRALIDSVPKHIFWHRPDGVGGSEAIQAFTGGRDAPL